MTSRRSNNLSFTQKLDNVTQGEDPADTTDPSSCGSIHRWWHNRRVLSISQKVCQTLWLGLLVYAFFGLPTLGRVFNVARFFHQFHTLKIMECLIAGWMQDMAIFLQASTCICFVKVLFDINKLMFVDLDQSSDTASFPNSGFMRDGSSSLRSGPVYMPVLTDESDYHDEGMETLVSGMNPTHRTLSSSETGMTELKSVVLLKRALQALVILILLLVILVIATIANVADFCLQVTLHPRLNRAFLAMFLAYMKKFIASFMDEELMTTTVVGSWVVYIVLMVTLTYGFFTGQLPLASEFLRLPSACCCDLFRRRCTMLKHSISSTCPSVMTSGSYVSTLFASYWHRAGKAIRIQKQSDQKYSPVPGKNQSRFSGQHATALALSLDSPGSSLATKSGPVPVLARCIFASLLMTGAALLVSLFVDRGGGMNMKLMNNAMFTLQLQPFFNQPQNVTQNGIDCAAASSTLRSTLGVSEKYELDGLDNDDHCALLWRKTIGYEGENIFELDLHATPSASAFFKAAAKPTKVQPNMIVINMESWRHLDVGVLGGAAKKKAFGKSATPRFDELAKTGVLYNKHYTPCVQTSRTIFSVLFGMLPSCNPISGLNQYSTTLNLRGLPHFLKQRGYYNLFWSAVDLKWEYWDLFLQQNGFDKLMGDAEVRKLLFETFKDKGIPDDHFGWGLHDNVSFKLLLYAIESARNANVDSADAANVSAMKPEIGNTTSVEDFSTPRDATAAKSPVPGLEGLKTPFFIDMYSISSHHPWKLPDSYTVPDLAELYTVKNKKYLDSVRFSDAALGDFIAALRAKGLMKNTIVIIEGDHGYGRLEHGNNPSAVESGVWDEVSRVPFLLLADDLLREEDKGTVVNQLTMQGDLMATIADILGVTPDKPLYQHGYGHSMKRRRSLPKAQSEAIRKEKDAKAQDLEADVVAAEAKDIFQDRRVVLCNPFVGRTTGLRTEEYKYVFHPDRSYGVFNVGMDPVEKKPLRSGKDMNDMDNVTRNVFEYVTKAVDLNDYLFGNNRFVTPIAKYIV